MCGQFGKALWAKRTRAEGSHGDQYHKWPVTYGTAITTSGLRNSSISSGSSQEWQPASGSDSSIHKLRQTRSA